jgi:hypothetical protein
MGEYPSSRVLLGDPSTLHHPLEGVVGVCARYLLESIHGMSRTAITDKRPKRGRSGGSYEVINCRIGGGKLTATVVVVFDQGSHHARGRSAGYRRTEVRR